jgi:hypothetical protein
MEFALWLIAGELWVIVCLIASLANTIIEVVELISMSGAPRAEKVRDLMFLTDKEK